MSLHLKAFTYGNVNYRLNRIFQTDVKRLGGEGGGTTASRVFMNNILQNKLD